MRKSTLACLVLLAVTGGVYAQVAGFPFINLDVPQAMQQRAAEAAVQLLEVLQPRSSSESSCQWLEQLGARPTGTK